MFAGFVAHGSRTVGLFGVATGHALPGRLGGWCGGGVCIAHFFVTGHAGGFFVAGVVVVAVSTSSVAAASTPSAPVAFEAATAAPGVEAPWSEGESVGGLGVVDSVAGACWAEIGAEGVDEAPEGGVGIGGRRRGRVWSGAWGWWRGVWEVVPAHCVLLFCEYIL